MGAIARSGWIILLLLACIIGIYAGWTSVLLPVRQYLSEILAVPKEKAHDDHAGHDHGSHDSGNSIEISENGLLNIGYEPASIELTDYERKLVLPAVVAERPGKTQFQIPAPLTGIVTKINITEGAAVEPNSPLFELRLTHEDLVTSQRDYLQQIENRDVLEREIKRLEQVSDGVIAGKQLLEKQYEERKLLAQLKAQKQALILHGLSEEQITNIEKNRQLLQALTVYAPPHQQHAGHCPEEHLYHIQELPIKLGQQVEAGDKLCLLADHCTLYLTGQAFESDAAKLQSAITGQTKLSARVSSLNRDAATITDLDLLYVSDRIDAEKKTFAFYIALPNSVLSQNKSPDGTHFMQWKYRPGQRMEVLIPIEKWEKKIVLPLSAIVDEGAESYLFARNGKKFERIAVHVLYRDTQHVVIEDNGSVFVGDQVAGRGAYQIQLALKNKSGGAIDPHAGHNH
jgi:multidrug efflux pump subunit AcrA (membrane-fusion protein)